MAIQETKDVLRFVEILGVKVAGNPALIKAIREKDWASAGGHGAALFADRDVQNAAVDAVNGIGQVANEVRHIGVLDGIDLGTTALGMAKNVYGAYLDNANV